MVVWLFAFATACRNHYLTDWWTIFFATALAAQEQFLTGVICVYFFSADTVVIFSRATEPVQVFTDDLGRKVTVPAHPKRIVSLHDLDITIPLIELGVPPVASHGRTRPDGSHFIRSGALLTGVDFDNSSIAFIGTADIDIEAIVAAKPDLIITEPTRNTPIEQLEKIAPTVSIDHLKGGARNLSQAGRTYRNAVATGDT